ncbi:hypothetical protein KQX63_06850 [Rhodopseudomonas palustris]|uniref:hypothetical protein n=1 Tax=Rhodopseudomonas palustris TaxID=1076 RepID=UPI0021F36F19|nr:hypothetical protein [Rhodopseudomonas palustris]UYO45726.1 hypothetical protein KQX63_06850 [Rhodopseudomonas palustris]
MIDRDHLPALTGSPDEIADAERIRAQHIPELREMQQRTGAGWYYPQMYSELVLRSTAASWWIPLRDASFDDICKRALRDNLIEMHDAQSAERHDDMAEDPRLEFEFCRKNH